MTYSMIIFAFSLVTTNCTDLAREPYYTGFLCCFPRSIEFVIANEKPNLIVESIKLLSF
jgi:hypothetical protein